MDMTPYYGKRQPKIETRPNPFEIVDVTPRERAPRMKRRPGRFYRQERRKVLCDACGWTPSTVARARIKQWRSMIHAHHIVPLSCGGKDDSSNVAMLCPTCHAFAHRLNPIRRVAPGDNDWMGPRTRGEVIAEIVAVVANEVATDTDAGESA
jgi:hypothetical protein